MLNRGFRGMVANHAAVVNHCGEQKSRTFRPRVKPAVGNSSPFLTNLPFHDFPKNVYHDSWLKKLGKLWSPNEEFTRVEQSVAYAFLNEFSISGRPKRVLTPLKSTSKTHTQRFVPPSKIMVPKRRFWKAEKTLGNVFSKNFSNERSPNLVLTYVKSALKIRSRMFVRPSKIFVWGPYISDKSPKVSTTNPGRHFCHVGNNTCET